MDQSATSPPEPGAASGLTPLERRRRRWAALKNERETWTPHWRSLADNIMPRRGRFLLTNTNRGGGINTQIMNAMPGYYLGVAQAGMMMGLTSPAQRWFRLKVEDDALAEAPGVKPWLDEVERRMRDIMATSNFYNALHTLYGELLLFGTAPMLVLEDYEEVIRCDTYTAGEYAVAANARGQVDTLYRECRLTVEQLVEKFGVERVSKETRHKYEMGRVDDWVHVLHAVGPRADRDQGPGHLSFYSDYWEANAQCDDQFGGFLRRSGFHERALVCPRWVVTGGDVYGRSPAMDALPDILALYQLERRKGLLVDHISDPAMQGPAGGLQGTTLNRLPGTVTLFPAGAGDGFRPLHQPPHQAIAAVSEETQRHEMRVSRTFFADLMLMMQQSDRRQITAREIEERHQEKLLALGPTLERLQSELLGPLIDRIYAIMHRNELLPPPPPDLSGEPIAVDYVSTLAQAQKSAAVAAIERVSTFAVSLGAAAPAVLDKLDVDEVVDAYNEAVGGPARIIRSDEHVARLREARAQQEEMARLAALAKPAKDAADAVTTLAEGAEPGAADAAGVDAER